MAKHAPMKAMILAAGRGARLAPLTDTLPKPLVEIGGETLIERHLRRLVAAGYSEVVINVAHLAQLLEDRLGDGSRYGAAIVYSRESDGPLETGGGIARALPLLGPGPFLVVNADIWTDYPFGPEVLDGVPARIVLIPNPSHHPRGDFTPDGTRARRRSSNTHTYAGIGIFEPALFGDPETAHFPLAPLLFELAAEGRLSCAVHTGCWFDIGTFGRLEEARARIGSLAAGQSGGT